MSVDALSEFVDDLGGELFGATWAAVRHHVLWWFESNPERVEWLRHRLRQAVEEGGL